GAGSDAVGSPELTLAPRSKEVAVAIKDDDRMLTAVEHVHVIARIDGHPGHLAEAPAGGQIAPVRQRLITVRPLANRAILSVAQGITLPPGEISRTVSGELEAAAFPL